MGYVKLVVMPEDQNDTTALAVVKLWGPDFPSRQQEYKPLKGEVVEMTRGSAKAIVIEIEDVLLNRIGGLRITLAGNPTEYSGRDFVQRFFRTQRPVATLALPYDLVFELKIPGHYNGMFTFTVRVK